MADKTNIFTELFVIGHWQNTPPVCTNPRRVLGINADVLSLLIHYVMLLCPGQHLTSAFKCLSLTAA